MDTTLENTHQSVKRRGFSTGTLILIVGLVAIVIIVGLGLVKSRATQPTSGPAFDFSLTTFTGENFQLSEHRGQVVVINFWASWCVPCRDEAPILQSLWEKYREQDVVLVGIAYADNERESLKFLEEFGITYPNGPDRGTRISDMYRIQGVPETFVVDQNGDIVDFIIAPVYEGQLDAVIDQLLES